MDKGERIVASMELVSEVRATYGLSLDNSIRLVAMEIEERKVETLDRIAKKLADLTDVIRNMR